MLKIYIRNDLKMRKGKMAAQSAHSAMKLLFDVMIKKDNKMILPLNEVKELKSFIECPKIEIIMSKDLEELEGQVNKEKPHSFIIDNGRTEFNGVQTLTCAAEGIFKTSVLKEINVPNTYGTEIKAKQIFIYNKDYPLSKIKACEQAVLSCMLMIFSKLKVAEDYMYYDLSEKNSFTDWITNAFGKIALSTENTESILDIEKQLIAQKIKYEKIISDNNICLCIEPMYPIDIDPITSTLKLI